jgi:hypothetical protein
LSCSRPRTRIARSKLLRGVLSGHPAGVLRLCLTEDYIRVADRRFINVRGSDDELQVMLNVYLAMLETEMSENKKDRCSTCEPGSSFASSE